MVPLHDTVRSAARSVQTPWAGSKGVNKNSTTGAAVTQVTTATATSTATPAGGTATTATVDPAADFKSLFGHVNASLLTPAPPAAAPKPPNPTLQSVFGTNPYATNPGGVGPNGVSYGYNPTYFATRATADKLAQMYGGTVVEANAITPYGPFQQNQMNEMIRFPNGNVVNAGILASYFDKGWSQEQINGAIAGEINQIPG